MARRKRKKPKSRRVSFKLRSSKPKKRRKASRKLSLTPLLTITAVLCILAGAVIGFVFLERYVKQTPAVAKESGPIELVNVPVWVNESLKAKIYAAATANSEDLKLDEDAAQSVQQNIESKVAWLDKPKVTTTHDSIRVEGRWRRPLVLVKHGKYSFYVDAEMSVLDYVPLKDLPIVQVKGLTLIKIPVPGDIWQGKDLRAAVAILSQLKRMDEFVTADKPLLAEIDMINVSNYNGRLNSSQPHITLYTKDNTQIIWGAEIGAWQRHLEAKDEDKLAKLYGYYKEHGTLSGDVKYINLRDPQDDVPQPIDKY